MKVPGTLVASFVMFFMASSQAQDAQIKMIQCEACSSEAGLKRAATGSGVGDWVVFSVENGIIARYLVEYDAGLDVPGTWSRTVPGSIEDGFALMLEVEAEKPRFFVSGHQDFRVDINKLGGGPHSSAAISLNGEHDSAYGSFIGHARSCLSSVGCASSLNPALGKLVGAEQKLNKAGISLSGGGLNIAWENLPPGVDLRFCDGNDDCALVTYDPDDRKWEYVESRAEGGTGKRYPRYGESLNYRFKDSGEADIFNRGLKDGGASVTGTWTSGTVLACADTGGVMRCEYIPHPE